VHQENAVLLAVMGKLAVKCGETFKAESYLAKSIAAEPTVQAYQLLVIYYLHKVIKTMPACVTRMDLSWHPVRL